MKAGMTIDGIHSSTFDLIVKSVKPMRAPILNQFITIPSMHGAYHGGSSLDVLGFTIELGIRAESSLDLHHLKRQIAYWIRPRSESVSIIFDDDPMITYVGYPDGAADLERFDSLGKGSFTLICTDPHGYGLERSQVINDPNGANVKDIIQNAGTAETAPIFTANILQPITFLDLVSPDAYMRIGEPVNVENEAPFVKEERLLWHQCNNLTGWTTASFVDGGVIAGTMITDLTKFLASSYGTGSAWHGPAIKTSIPNGPLIDFRVDALVGMENGQARQMGRVEIYLLDDANNAIAKMALKDTSSGIAATAGEMRIGDNTINYFLMSDYGDARSSWNNFYGMLRIERVGKKWTAYIAKIAQGSGRHHTRRTVTFLDEDYLFNKQVSQIAVHVAQYGNNMTAAPAIYDVKVFRINQTDDTKIPYIADTGDIIEFDHKIKEIRLNGETRNDLKEFGGTFFSLGTGDTQLAVNPPESASVEVAWRDKWL